MFIGPVARARAIEPGLVREAQQVRLASRHHFDAVISASHLPLSSFVTPHARPSVVGFRIGVVTSVLQVMNDSFSSLRPLKSGCSRGRRLCVGKRHKAAMGGQERKRREENETADDL
ncbi:hypothetical protein [Pseudomonas monteilii]|uniref:hypothetical protein n=1 Tax=Pseudomonas monteilii TaxID=76759 RepID=UPI0011C4A459|nr:hypothetical protein [Pseudomonas monteilii]